MGDPKKIRKKYNTPAHPWQKARIDEEREPVRRFGLKSKKEIWKAASILKNLTEQAKSLVVRQGPQAEVEMKNLLKKVQSLGLGTEKVTIDDVLALKTEDILSRRLQTVVFQQQKARTVSQARQFIVHGHVTVNGVKLTVPAYLVKATDVIGYAENSSLNDPEHPERYVEKLTPEEEAVKAAAELKAKKKKVVDEDLDVDDSLLAVSDEEVEKKITIPSADDVEETVEVKKDE
ncbi:30S ribosomal protein S4 [Candidatus Woesearchaeota archaeon]|nr:30S ribosomal protein S4 [Candidatus Woesearchaeota archaeon]